MVLLIVISEVSASNSRFRYYADCIELLTKHLHQQYQNMVRPKASKDSLDMAGSFALAVTTESKSGQDLIARIGNFSIFALFSRIAPEV